MCKATNRKTLLLEISSIESKIEELKFKIASCDETYSDADEFPYSRENLEFSLEELLDLKKDLLKKLKEIEKI